MTGLLDPGTAAVVVRAAAVGVPLLVLVALCAWRTPSPRATWATMSWGARYTSVAV